MEENWCFQSFGRFLVNYKIELSLLFDGFDHCALQATVSNNTIKDQKIGFISFLF
jgi:hypothetical protein